jgi:hypothetical protein
MFPNVRILALALTLLGCTPSFVASPSSMPSLRQEATVPNGCADSGQPFQLAIPAGSASGAEFFLPASGEYILDAAVPEGKEIVLTIASDEQYKALAAGTTPPGQPLLRTILRGSSKQASVILERGNYFMAFNNTANTPVSFWWRCSFLRR